MQNRKNKSYTACFRCERNKSQFWLCSKCSELLLDEKKIDIHEHPLLLVNEGIMYYSKCFPINQIHKEGYTIKKSCEICKNY